jgi:hypothetical protein
MARREHRISEFNISERSAGVDVQLLRKDHNGTYALRLACRFIEGGRVNAVSRVKIESDVLGWRPYSHAR